MQNPQRFCFATNHADPLVAKVADHPASIEAVLLSAHYSTRASLKKVKQAKESGAMVVSDNGNFSRMSKIARKFLPRGVSLLANANAQLIQFGAIQNDLLMERELLFENILVACQAEQRKVMQSDIIAKQLLCSPDYMIGLENFVIPVATMVGLMRPIFQPDPRRILPYQALTLDAYLKQKAGLYGSKPILDSVRKYLVLHAYDFASARQGASAFGALDLEGLAISFGGPMASRDYITSISFGGRVHAFGEKLPEAYLIAVALVAGVNAGLETKGIPIHILGLGSPIMIALLGYLLRSSEAVSIDATSTFKDADDGNIYALEPAFIKLDMYKVAAFALIRGEAYRMDSPYFLEFENNYPSDWIGLRNALSIQSSDLPSQVAARLIENPKLLEQYIPYFTPMRKGTDQRIKAVRVARSGSNYWVIKEICRQIRSLDGDAAGLKSWVANAAKNYQAIASPKWAKAVTEILRWFEYEGL